ncbi:hypothetical protein [Jidongwangia harbinensis]|uniref:hypothetical protein n=1 Tax=Jidongwangia harbinensis TaxID=2878561 RepID=UPI001CD9283A|nr:hypothetical protein [Jidongwangia harbinensis]MCA2218129.1 hypothetical protein [Jidongwangia harbinensis]
MQSSWRFPVLIAAGGVAAAGSVLVIPGPAPSASVAAFVPPSAAAPVQVESVAASASARPRAGELASLIRALIQRAEASR